MEDKVKTISIEEYNKLIDRLDAKEKELNYFKGNNLLVGVRFYGEGSFAVGLNKPINGLNRTVFFGYDSKGVIDYAGWTRIFNSNERRWGIAVRDDSVIDELGILGTVAPIDSDKNPNAFTNSQIKDIFGYSEAKFKKVVDAFTSYFPARHFIKVMEAENIEDIAKKSIIRSRYNYLFDVYRWSILGKHELRAACELNDIPFDEQTTEREMVERLIAKTGNIEG